MVSQVPRQWPTLRGRPETMRNAWLWRQEQWEEPGRVALAGSQRPAVLLSCAAAR